MGSSVLLGSVAQLVAKSRAMVTVVPSESKFTLSISESTLWLVY